MTLLKNVWPANSVLFVYVLTHYVVTDTFSCLAGSKVTHRTAVGEVRVQSSALVNTYVLFSAHLSTMCNVLRMSYCDRPVQLVA